MKLTSFSNGMVIDVDREKLDVIGPHVEGGSVIKVGELTYRVKETVNEILRNDRQST